MTTRPKRIQRRRVKGWRMPEGAVYVGRPTVWGNPFPWTAAPGGRPQSVAMFKAWLADEEFDWGLRFGRAYDPKNLRAKLLSRIRDLRGKDLVCWCPLDQPCHADILLEIANK